MTAPKNTTGQPDLLAQSTPRESKKFLSSMSVYPLEVSVAMVTIMILASVLSFGIFALCNFFYDQGNTSLGYFSLWTSASTLVWLPVAFIFYVRSRGYMNQHPEVVNSTVQRTATIIYQVLMILSIIGFAFTSIYALFTGLVQVSEAGRTLVGVALPAALSAALFAGAFVAFFRKPVASRKLYGGLMLLISLLVVLPVVVYSIVSLRSVNVDVDRVKDLEAMQRTVRDYYSNKRELPDSIDDIVDYGGIKLHDKASVYGYSKKDRTSYELCTTFVADTLKGGEQRRSTSSTYTDFSRHGKGKQCFEQTAGYSSYYDEYDYDDR